MLIFCMLVLSIEIHKINIRLTYKKSFYSFNSYNLTLYISDFTVRLKMEFTRGLFAPSISPSRGLSSHTRSLLPTEIFLPPSSCFPRRSLLPRRRRSLSPERSDSLPLYRWIPFLGRTVKSENIKRIKAHLSYFQLFSAIFR